MFTVHEKFDFEEFGFMYDSVHLDSVSNRFIWKVCPWYYGSWLHKGESYNSGCFFFPQWKEKFYYCSYRFGPFSYPCTDKSLQRFKSGPDWLVCEIMSPFMMLRYIPTVSVNLNWKRACGFHCEPFVHSKLQFELSLIIIYGNTFRFKITFFFFFCNVFCVSPVVHICDEEWTRPPI